MLSQNVTLPFNLLVLNFEKKIIHACEELTNFQNISVLLKQDCQVLYICFYYYVSNF